MEQLIADLGFPIACVVGCAYFIWNTTQQQRIDNGKREDRMFEQLDKFGDSLDSFNETLCKIDKRLETVEKQINDLKGE